LPSLGWPWQHLPPHRTGDSPLALTCLMPIKRSPNTLPFHSTTPSSMSPSAIYIPLLIFHWFYFNIFDSCWITVCVSSPTSHNLHPASISQRLALPSVIWIVLVNWISDDLYTLDLWSKRVCCIHGNVCKWGKVLFSIKVYSSLISEFNSDQSSEIQTFWTADI